MAGEALKIYSRSTGIRFIMSWLDAKGLIKRPLYSGKGVNKTEFLNLANN
jgi:hypothetical protein